MKQTGLLRRQNSRPFRAKFLLLRYHMSILFIARGLVEESGMDLNSDGGHNWSEMVAAWDALWNTIPQQ
jgi:hypothetical protein